MIYTITLNPAIDKIIEVDGHLTKKKTNRVRKHEYDLGGKGLHVSNVMNQFGVENTALGFIGERNERLMLKILDEKGIHHQLIREPDKETRECIVILDDSKDGSTMITGAGFEISYERFGKLLSFIQKKVQEEDVVVVAGSLPPDMCMTQFEQLLMQIKQTSCFLACDLSGDALKKAVEVGVDFIKPNQHEIQDLELPKDVPLIGQLEQLARNIQYVVVSLGEKGCYMAHKDSIYKIMAPAVEEVNDTGAGDVFVGAFIAQLAKRAPLETMIRYAVGCSASKVTHRNCTDFDIEHAKSLFQQIKIKQVEVEQNALS
ncbi:1-phosphofructokinase family hexose kinase [Metabacillus arenae]|uniref:Tagatose-6-phosphate kinase n=1 Tax=Metabacillus arenae TaxID=2771434 RepID=A0A926RYC7_9BACI|nr:1-phosphofructokinase family hexose kinase [Metabacillus arenae]MBD1382803.1 1-phosphofructokinase family hexose kinase [Metabacillus arenae]